MKAYLWQFGDSRNGKTEMKLQITKIPGRSVRRIRRMLEETGWVLFGDTEDKDKLKDLMFEKIFTSLNKAKRECKSFEFECVYIDRNNNETRLTKRKSSGRPKKTDENRKPRINPSKKQRSLTDEEMLDLKRFFADNKEQYNLVSLQGNGETERTFNKHINQLIRKRYDVICKPENVYALMSKLNLSHIIPAKGKRGRKKA